MMSTSPLLYLIMPSTTLRHSSLALILGLALVGCDASGSGDAPSTRINLRFATTPYALSAPSTASNARAANPDEITVDGSNGTLTLTDIRLLVAELELERAGGSCDDVDGEDDGDDCEAFEAPPAFVDLPLADGAVSVGSDLMPKGEYDELEFEVEDLDLDEDDADDLDALAAAVRAEFPDWPDQASAVVIGTFTPTGGAARPFTAYLDAEIEVELAFSPPLQVLADGTGDVVTVEVDPARWFARDDGSVVDLSAYDFESGGRLLEFELELERGFDLDHDDDDAEVEDDDS